MKKSSLIFVCLIFIFIFTTLYLSLNNKKIYNTEDIVGEQISEVEFPLLNRSGVFSTKEISYNKFTLLNFWASWCGPCRVEHPVLMKLSAENNLDILGVNFKDKKELARKFLKDLGNPYNSLLKDDEGKQSVIFGIYGIPESLIINNKNTIIKKFVGPLSLDDYKEIKEMIK